MCQDHWDVLYGLLDMYWSWLLLCLSGPCCNLLFSVAVINTMTKSHFWSLVQLIPPSHSPPLEELQAGTQSRNHGETLLTGAPQGLAQDHA